MLFLPPPPVHGRAPRTGPIGSPWNQLNAYGGVRKRALSSTRAIHPRRDRRGSIAHGLRNELTSSVKGISQDHHTLQPARRIIAIEQQGHGHIADINRPFSIGQWAQDTIALLRHLGIEQTDFFGYSSGGAVTLEIALRSPALVRKLVWAGGTSYRRDGLYSEMLKASEAMKPEGLDDSPFQQAYANTAAHPEQWHRLVAKVADLDRRTEGWSPEAIASVKAPTLLIIGDSDIVRLEHVVEMFRLLGGGVAGDLVGLPGSQLAVLPGTTHVTLVDRTEWLTSMITAFLDAPASETR